MNLSLRKTTISFVLTTPPADGHAEIVVSLRPSRQNARIVPHLYHDHFLPNPLQFISLSSHYSTLYSLKNESVAKIFHKEEEEEEEETAVT
jgi:hypothetical protein